MPMTPIAENENDLQRLLHPFYVKAKPFYMQVSTRKTNALVTSKEPMRCLANETIEQVITNEVREQANKASRISGALREIILNDTNMSKKLNIKKILKYIKPVLDPYYHNTGMLYKQELTTIEEKTPFEQQK
ncbi:hypothetical protein HUJ04_005463 [Dendroctonus ponderosae]|nr:hypothetical protein HUJ04_005463 [Dendroctonus ponderosae]